MTYKIIIGLLVLLCLATNQSVAQTTDRFIKVGDTTVNLRDVDLEKGLEISNKKASLTKKNVVSVEVQKTIYKALGNGLYLIANDTSKFYKGGYDGSSSSYMEVLDSNSKLIFTKHFSDANITKCHIAPSGKLIVLEIGSMEREEIHLYDGKGEILGKYSSYDNKIDASYLNNIIALTKEDRETDTFITYFYFNGSLFNKQLSFNGEPIISFSSNEKVIMIRHNGLYKIYDLKLELVKEISFAEYHINVFNNGNNYSIKKRDRTMYCEIKDFKTDVTVFFLDSITFKDEKLPIYTWGVMNHGNDIFINTSNNGLEIFSFYGLDGKLINIVVTDQYFFSIGDLDFYKENDKYEIRINHDK